VCLAGFASSHISLGMLGSCQIIALRLLLCACSNRADFPQAECSAAQRQPTDPTCFVYGSGDVTLVACQHEVPQEQAVDWAQAIFDNAEPQRCGMGNDPPKRGSQYRS
jgi:hypothetical protein